jgi:hypothetical protein
VYLYHTWHPNQYGWNTDYQGPHDGVHMSLLALDARGSFRVGPCLKNPWLGAARWGRTAGVERLLRRVAEREEPAWRVGAQPAQPPQRVYWVERDYYGFDVFHHAGTWYALRTGGGGLDPRKVRDGAYREVWRAPTQPGLRGLLPIDREGWERRANDPRLLPRLWRKFRAQPLRRLPARLARSARTLTSP